MATVSNGTVLSDYMGLTKNHVDPNMPDSAPHARARREALIYCLINHFDSFEKIDGAENVRSGYRRPLTKLMKMRYRNMTVREAVNYVNKHNANLKQGDKPLSIDDPAVIIDAFFKTPFGVQFASHKDSWVSLQNDQLKDYLRKIDGWTIGNSQPGSNFTRTIVSPYDPQFAANDGMNDKLCYVFNGFDTNGNSLPITNDVGLSSLTDLYKNPNDVPTKDLEYKRRNMVMEPNRELIKNIYYDDVNKHNSRIRVMSDVLRNSGYVELSKYVTDSKTRTDLSTYMGITRSANGSVSSPVVMTQDQRTYISEACDYMINKGYEFDIELETASGANGSTNLNRIVLKTKTDNISITLYDRSPDNQGQIFKGGVSARIPQVNSDSSYRRTGLANGQTIDLVSHEDRMAMLKWYFGERVPLLNIKGTNVSNDTLVGQRKTIKLGREAVNWGVDSSHSCFNTVKYSEKRSDNHMLLVGFKNIRDANGSVVSKKPIYISMKPSYADSISENVNLAFVNSVYINENVYGGNSAREKFGMIPTDKILPVDVTHDVDANGNVITQFDLGRGKEYGDTLVKSKRLNYYCCVLLRNELSKWVERAKSNHAAMVDIDTIIDLYSKDNVDNDAVEAWIQNDSGEREIGEIKRICKDILSGKIVDLTDGSESRKSVMSIGPSKDDKVRAVREYYTSYVNREFGSVPDLAEPTLDADGNIVSFNGFVKSSDAETGFVPGNVIKYTRGDIDYGDQNTNVLLRYMVYRLGEFYSVPDLVKGDSYSAVDMKNKTIRFNPDLSIGSIAYSEVSDIDEDDLNKMLQQGLARLNLPVHDMSVTADMMLHTVRTLVRNGCDPSSVNISIDANGVMHYKGAAGTIRSGVSDEVISARDKIIEGDLGQVFEPDQYGVIDMKTVVDSGKVYIPGYTATILPKGANETDPINKRLRVFSWQFNMKKAISREIHDNVFKLDSERLLDPKGAALNSIVKNGYNSTMPRDDYHARLPKDPAHPTEDEHLFLQCLKSDQLTAHLSKEWAELATTDTQASIDHPYEDIARRTNYIYSDWADNINLREHCPEFDNIVDARCVAGAKNQGTNLHFVESVKINPDGTVDRSPVENDLSPILKTKAFKNSDHDTVDRVLGASNNVLSALRTDMNTRVAMMNCGGATYEDGIVISKAYADRNVIRGADGTYRPLLPQDKLSDFHFNKGVVSYVIDPDFHSENIMTHMKACEWMGEDFDIEDKAIKSADFEFNNRVYHVDFDEKSSDSRALQAAHYIQKMNNFEGLDDLITVFRDNPDLDVIVSPYSAMSRFNGGTILDMMEQPGDLKLNGKVVKGCMGTMPFMVHDMLADTKSHIYNDDSVQDGVGRKASSQLAWGLTARNARAIMSEFYGNDDRVMHNAREYFIAIGMDLDIDGKPVIGYRDQETVKSVDIDGETKLVKNVEKRNLFKLPDSETFNSIGFKVDGVKRTVENPVPTHYDSLVKKGGKDSSIVDALVREMKFEDNVAVEKDILALIENAGGFMELPFNLNFATRSRMNFNKPEYKDAFRLLATNQSYKDGAGKDKPTYAMPVLSHVMRSGIELADGSSRSHNYTNKYIDIYKNALKYMAFERELASDKAQSDERYSNVIRNCMNKCKTAAQSSFNGITNDIIKHKFADKNCFVRKEVMNYPIKHSGTVLWSADPRAKINEVHMSADSATKLHVKEGDSVVIWRDPVTKSDVIGVLKVVVDKPGVKISCDKTIDLLKKRARKTGEKFDINTCKPVPLSYESNTYYPPMTEDRLRHLISQNPDLVRGSSMGNYIPVIHTGVSVTFDGSKKAIDMTTAEYMTKLVDHKNYFSNCTVSDLYMINGKPVSCPRGHYDANQNMTLDKYVVSESKWIKYVDFDTQGIKVNPAIAKKFNGDFDGDTVALAKLESLEALKEAKAIFGIENNLLNRGSFTEVSYADHKDLIRGVGEDKNAEKTIIYPLFIQPELEMASHVAENPELAKEFDRLTIEVNNLYRAKTRLEEYKKNKPDDTTIDRTVVLDRDGNINFNADPNVEPSKSSYTGFNAIRVASEKYRDEFDELVHKAMAVDIGTDKIIVDDIKSVAQSYQIIIDHKAKGDAKKFRFLADNLGIDYKLDENDKIIIDSIEYITDPETGKHCTRAQADGVVDKAINDSRIVTSLKADDTALGGRSAQLAVRAFRDSEILDVLLFLTEPTTQSILQSKHDPEDAKHKDYIVRCWGKDILNGYKLTGDFTTDRDTLRKESHQKISTPMYDANGNQVLDDNGRCVYTYQKCTREEWIQQVKGLMTALNVEVNPKYIEQAADVMINKNPSGAYSTNGNTYYKDASMYKDCVIGFEDYAKEHASLLDRIAYGTDRLGEVLNEALKPIEERDSLFGNAAKVAKAQANAVDKDGNAESVDEKIKNTMQCVNNSALFAPKSFIKGHVENKPVIMGFKDTLVDYETAVPRISYFGETEADYELRMSRGWSVDNLMETRKKGSGSTNVYKPPKDDVSVSFEVDEPRVDVVRKNNKQFS